MGRRLMDAGDAWRTSVPQEKFDGICLVTNRLFAANL